MQPKYISDIKTAKIVWQNEESRTQFAVTNRASPSSSSLVRTQRCSKLKKKKKLSAAARASLVRYPPPLPSFLPASPQFSSRADWLFSLRCPPFSLVGREEQWQAGPGGGESRAARTWRRKIPRWPNHSYQLEAADLEANRCPMPPSVQGSSLADGMQLVDSVTLWTQVIFCLALLLSWAYLFSPIVCV
jgi:hypothetical protein